MRDGINMLEFINIINKYVKSYDIKVIMEIGSLDARDGQYFKLIYPNSTVYCIEGLKDNYDKYMSHLTDIIPINTIISDYDGTIDYYKKKINGIHGILNRGDEYGDEVLENMECQTIKTLCNKLNLTNIDIVKIDVEGATYEILKSMKDILQTIKIMHIETESYEFFKGQKLHDEVVKLLNTNNFTMLNMTSVDIEKGKEQHDSVWINNKIL